MFDSARPFPDYPTQYPFTNPGVATIFGKGFHTRMRLHPGGRLVYTVGAGTEIHVFDLERGEMVANVAFPGGEGAVLQDVAFSADGNELYAVALVKGKDAVFGTASISGDGTKHEFRPVTVLCGTTLVTLGTIPKIPGRVFAIGRGKGLYAIDPANVPTEIQPLVAFNAVGQLVLDTGLSHAYATATAPAAATDAYDQVLRIALPGGTSETFPLKDPSRNQPTVTGRDDIAFSVDRAGRGRRLHVIADPAAGESAKRLLIFDTERGPGAAPTVADGLDDSELRLASDPSFTRLVVSSEDGYRLQLVDIADAKLVPQYRHPAQISPIAVAIDGGGGRVLALNFLSNTITVIPAKALDPETDPRLAELGAYRDGVLEAFTDLFACFLQYLKDCFCDHLLLKCPTCTEDDKLYLAAVSIRGGRVYQVCNFSRRKYLKTLPGIGYWLSIVPVIPLLDRAIATFCCTVLPQFFSKVKAPEAKVGAANRVKSAPVRKGVTTTQTVDARSLISQWLGELNLTDSILGDAAGSTIARFTAGPSTRGVQRADIVDAPTAAATTRLEERGVVVERVEPYDPGRVANLIDFSRAPSAIPRGAKVTLFEQDGKVRYYTLSRAPEIVAGEDRVKERLDARDEEVAKLLDRVKRLETQVKRLQGPA
jgi:hypothetical protein